ncbi:MAG: hypothetical protein II214_04630, partial [Alistipes sp.]|nr:hypothetical protein [Alistipes sp.]
MITKESVRNYFSNDFTSDLDGYFIVSNWQRSEETLFGVSDDTHFINLYQRNSNSTITPVCYSWKTTERDLIFSAIFAYLYVA